MKTIKLKKLSNKAILPTRNHSTDAGLDLYASEDTFIPINSTIKVSTGIAVDIDASYWGFICDRSSMAAKGLRTGAGVVDTGYQGELTIVMHNLNNKQNLHTNHEGYQIKAGDKIAQLVIQPVCLPQIQEVNEFEDSERKDKGFGSSGR